jgi:hypothetical protein
MSKNKSISRQANRRDLNKVIIRFCSTITTKTWRYAMCAAHKA